MNGKHDELITLRMPVWAFQGIMNGIEKWAGDHWDTFEITKPIEFVDLPPSWEITEEDGRRYLLPRE
jgi:hypothetical protein